MTIQKKVRAEDFKSMEVMVLQGMRSRHQKIHSALDELEDQISTDPHAVTNAQINEARQSIEALHQNFEQFVAYRKMAGLD